MTVFPYTRLFLGSQKSIIISGPHIQVVDVQTGDVVHSTASLSGDEKDALFKSGSIRCSAVDAAFTHVVASADDKRLKVWQVDGLRLISERELPKKPTEIQFTRNGQTILVSDKFGDVFRYPLHPPEEPAPAPDASSAPGSSKRGALTSHENPSNGTLVLGHASLLTCFLLSPDERHILTADRDEHIRVSWYPQGFNIERYCLGHEKFVSALHIPPFAPETLVSGGGDPVLKLWDWMAGTLLGEIPVLDAVLPYIKVKAAKNKWGREDDDDGEEKAENSTARRRKHARKGKQKGKDTPEYTPEAEVEAEADVADDDGASGRIGIGASSDAEAEQVVLVLHRIQSLELGGHGRFLLFSAVGSTAMFYCTFPEDQTAPPLDVRILELGKPVIDFTLGADGLIWVLLDGAWGAEDTAEPQLVKVLSLASGTLSEVSPSTAGLLSSLRSKCVISATPEDLKKLDLYSALAAMPKNVDPEHDPVGRSQPLPPPNAEGSEKQLTLREQARLKKKRALEAQLLAQAQAKNGAGVDTHDDARESKRAKSETADRESDVPTSDAMDEL